MRIQYISPSFNTTTCFGCLHQPSSGLYQVTKRIEREQTLSLKIGVQNHIKSDKCYPETGKITLEIVLEGSLV
jgi:hypothetical protein